MARDVHFYEGDTGDGDSDIDPPPKTAASPIFVCMRGRIMPRRIAEQRQSLGAMADS